MTLAELVLAGAGASVNGSGEVTMDFTAMTSASDMPRAKGALSFVTLGANALVERLNQLGMLSADDLQAARMGLLFIGRLQGGEDRLVTELQFDGTSVTLNGQRIR